MGKAWKGNEVLTLASRHCKNCPQDSWCVKFDHSENNNQKLSLANAYRFFPLSITCLPPHLATQGTFC